jgi:dihydroorotase
MSVILKNCLLIEGLSNILIEEGKIVDIKPSEQSETFGTVNETIDIKGNLVIPGVIDAHVHVRDLQQAYKEDWETASMAALAGGVTTIFDMPNTLPATINLKNLNIKRKAAEMSLVNYKFFIGATNSNQKDIEEILDKNAPDIAGIKVFLAGSVSNETVTDEDILKQVFELAKQYDKVVVIHTELQELLDKWQQRLPYNNILKHNAIRNRQCAIKGTELVLRLSEVIGNKIYIAHVSTFEEIELIKKYKCNNQVFCEVTPHHLLLNESILEKVGNIGKVNPPLRSEKDNAALWQAINNGIADTIGTDHAPHTIEEKQQEYEKAPSGFPGLETCLLLLLNEVNEGNLKLEKLIELTSNNPAKIFQLEKRGEIKVGNFADLSVIDLNKKWKINASAFRSKAKYSPFDGIEVKGKVMMTFVDGKILDVSKEVIYGTI